MAKKRKKFFERFANSMTQFTGSSVAFVSAVAIVVIWAVSGPLFDFSETWQLVINTGTTIITFLMVFLIQKAQNKDSKAIQLKLNELIASTKAASNRMVDIEDLTEEELDQLHKFYVKLSGLAKKEIDIHQSHSIDAALSVHQHKFSVLTEAKKSIESNQGANQTHKSKPPSVKKGAKKSTSLPKKSTVKH